jgi:RluA family pseudouridine synthase
MPYEITISEENHNSKPKNFLKKTLDLPYHLLYKHIKNKRITLNGKKIKQDSILKQGDVIKVWLDEIKLRQKQTSMQNVHAKNLHLETLKETDDFIVLNKKPGIVVQGAQENENSLSLHLTYIKKKNNDNSDFNYFHAHRIDKQTSGAILCAKTKKALKDLNEMFRLRKIKKKYHCLCVGKFEQKQGKIVLYLERTEEGVKQKVRALEQPSSNSKRAVSNYKILEEFTFNDEIISLVEVEIETGVMHQIRVSLKHIGHPILGDTMYGNSFINNQVKEFCTRQCLHASSLEFDYKDKHYTIEAPFTEDFEYVLSHLKTKN